MWKNCNNLDRHFSRYNIYISKYVFKKKLYLVNFPDDNDWFFFCTPLVVYYNDIGFNKKIVLPQVKAEKRLSFTIFTTEVNGKHAITTEKNQYVKIFPERIEIFLQKYVGHIIIKQTVIWWKFTVPIFCYKIKCDIKFKKWVKNNYANYIFFEKCLGLACFNIPMMLVNMESCNRFLDGCIPLSVSYTQGGRKQIIPLLSLTCHLAL